MKILFLHGWHSIPGGVKPTFLHSHGHEIINPSLDDDDFDNAIATAQAEYERSRPDVIVGSSRGGAIAIQLHSRDTPLILLCPAWKNWGEFKPLKPNALILHSRKDDVIPFESSEELVDLSGLSRELLIEVGNDHRLADSDSLEVMLWGCNLLTSGNQLPSLSEEFPMHVECAQQGGEMFPEEASYLCDACGEEIVIPLDVTQGSSQTYVEDCPVCCRANKIHVLIDAGGSAQVWAEPEQDHDWSQ
jgi:hypothetical protein